jgi:hypothetical protein
MRFLAAGLALLAACTTMQNDVRHRILHSGDQVQRPGPRRQATLVTTAEAYRRSWSSIVGSGEPPAVDFDRESVLFLVSEQKPTGGYEIVLNKVAQESETLVIDAAVKNPPEGSMNIQVLTTPFIVVAVEKRDVTRVQWAE